MRNLFTWILIIIFAFLMVLPFNCVLASEENSEFYEDDTGNPETIGSDSLGLGIDSITSEDIEKLQTQNPFERVFSKFLLSVGDYVAQYLPVIFREEITIDRIVYNKVYMLNANFFEKSTNAAVSPASSGPADAWQFQAAAWTASARRSYATIRASCLPH
mgnify:CR=1 FL=1